MVAVARQAGTCPAEARVDTASWVVGSDKYNIQKYKIKENKYQPSQLLPPCIQLSKIPIQKQFCDFKIMYKLQALDIFFQANYGSQINLNAQFSTNFLFLIWCSKLPWTKNNPFFSRLVSVCFVFYCIPSNSGKDSWKSAVCLFVLACPLLMHPLEQCSMNTHKTTSNAPTCPLVSTFNSPTCHF